MNRRTEVAAVNHYTDVVVVNSRIDVVVVNPRIDVAVVNSRIDVAVVNSRTVVAVVNPRTGVAVANPRTGVVGVNSHTGVVVLSPGTGVVHHGGVEALHGHRLVEDQEEWSKKVHIQVQKVLMSIHSHIPLAQVALRDPQREAHRNGVLEGLMAACIQERCTRSLHSCQLEHYRKLSSTQFRTVDRTPYHRGYPQPRDCCRNTHFCACPSCPSYPSYPSYLYPYPCTYPYPCPSSLCPCPCPSCPSGVFRPHRGSAAGITDLLSLRLRAPESWI